MAHDAAIDATIAFLEQYAPSVNYPAVGALFLDERGNGDNHTICTGTLIAPRWVLSADHCLQELCGETPCADHVYLPAEGIIGIRGYRWFCQRDPSSCDANANDLLLVELDRPAEVWEPVDLRLTNQVIEQERRRVGFGARLESPSCPSRPWETTVGTGIKHVVSLSAPVEVEHDPPPPESRTIRSNSTACSGDSGGPLLFLEPAVGGAEQAAVVRSGFCRTPVAKYVNVAHDELQDWIARKASPGALRDIRQIRWWGRVQQGVVAKESQCSLPELSTMVRVPGGGAATGWAVPADWGVSDIVVDVPPEADIDLLRATLNYQGTPWTCCENCPRNKFRLDITSPSGATDRCGCSDENWTYIHCDCKVPETGRWKFKIVAEEGVGKFQLMILPLGPPEPRAHAPTATRSVGAELRSAPLILVNLKEDGTPSEELRGLILQYEIKPEMARLRRERERTMGQP